MKPICIKCGEPCDENDYNEFTGMCLECDSKDFKQMIDEYYDSLYKNLAQNLIAV